MVLGDDDREEPGGFSSGNQGGRKTRDRLKSITQGHGSFDYELLDYRLGDLVKVDILVNGEQVDALSQLVHREFSRPRALRYCERLAKTIPRQQRRGRGLAA